MTKFKALFIKYLRVRHDYSWRSVQRELFTRYNLKRPFGSEYGTGNASTNQIDGMVACEKAMKFLGEEVSDGW